MTTKTHLILYLFLALFPLCMMAQEELFEGEIVYSVDLQYKTGEISNEQVKNLLGDKQNYYIEGNKFKQVTNGSQVINGN